MAAAPPTRRAERVIAVAGMLIAAILAALAIGVGVLTALGLALAALAVGVGALTAWAVRVTQGARAALERAGSDKQRFLSAASHDMRQPLHALTLYLSALDRRVEGEEARGILARCDRAAQALVDMLNAVVDLARLNAADARADFDAVALQDVIAALCAAHPGAVADNETMLIVRADRRLLERALRELFVNAIRHGGGARISVHAEDGAALVTVSDSGPGIAPEDHARMFEEFVRLGRAEGLGLGLAIAKRCAVLMGCDISVRSAPGEGAALTLRLKLA